MTFSADIYEIAVLIIALAFLALVIVAIPMVLQIKRTVKSLEELSGEGRQTVEKVNSLIQRAGDEAGEFEDIAKKVRELSYKAIGLAELVLDGVRSPLVSILSLLFGLEFGLKQVMKHKKKEEEGGSSHE